MHLFYSSFSQSHRHSVPFLCFVFIYFLSSFYFLSTLRVAFAEETSPSSNVSPDDFDKICKDTLSNASGNSTIQEKLSYCQAAKSSQEAANSNGILWKVWASVSAVCTASCAASFIGYGNQYICLGINVAVGITDAAITRQFASALIAIATAGAAFGANKFMKNQQDKKDEAPEKKPKDLGACMIAAQAAFQAFSKAQSEKNSLDSLKNNLASAQACNSDSSGAIKADSIPQPQNRSPLPDSVTQGSTGGNSKTSPPSLSANNSNPSGCDSTKNSKTNPVNSLNTATLITQCAVSLDSNLPNYINQPQFQTDFKKSTGIPLSEFLSKNETPKKELYSVMDSALHSADSSKLAEALQTMEQQIPIKIQSSVYTGSNSLRTTEKSDSDPSFGEAMNHLMNQFLPKKEDGKQNLNQNYLTFEKQQLQSTTPSENKNLSLFDRISNRYYHLND